MRFLFIILSVVFLLGFSTENSKEFSPSDAVNMVLQKHPEFPSKIDEVITKQVGVGGPCCDNKVRVELTTKIEELDRERFIVTLTKYWKFTYNGNYALSYWKYKVTSQGLCLIDYQNEEDLHKGIK